MQISQTPPARAGTISQPPPALLASLADGQRLVATVIARQTSQLVSLRVADTILQLNTTRALEPGQKIELQRVTEGGQARLRPIFATPVTISAAGLRPGQQLSVEVVEVLADRRLLVRPGLLSPATATGQLEIDIRPLTRTFRPGDRLVMEVIGERPLTVRLRSDVPDRAQVLQSYLQSLQGRLPSAPTGMPALSALPGISPARPLQRALSLLVDRLTDSRMLHSADGVRRALQHSGVFLESHLRYAAQAEVSMDTRGNLLRLAQALQSELRQGDMDAQLRNLLATLPAELRTLLQAAGRTPQGWQALLALASQPASPPALQQLVALLSAESAVSGVQRYLLAREVQAALGSVVRIAEWQWLRDLLRDVEGLASRIQFNQLSMAREGETTGNVNSWLFEIPVRDRQFIDLIQLRLERHLPEAVAAGEAIWQVQLNLDTRNLGPLQARISLHRQDVKIVFLAEHPGSVGVLEQHTDGLKRRLGEMGLSVSHLSCRQQRVAPLIAPAVSRQQSASGLVDISV